MGVAFKHLLHELFLETHSPSHASKLHSSIEPDSISSFRRGSKGHNTGLERDGHVAGAECGEPWEGGLLRVQTKQQ